jgi:ABC-type arginine/histidine transport system permease subunit
MLRCPRCSRCISVGLVCACLFQGVKAPPAAVISLITSPSPVIMASSTTASVSTIAVNSVLGKTYDVAPLRKPLHGEPDDS